MTDWLTDPAEIAEDPEIWETEATGEEVWDAAALDLDRRQVVAQQFRIRDLQHWLDPAAQEHHHIRCSQGRAQCHDRGVRRRLRACGAS